MIAKNIWIFSSIIDNFGDIGIAYRLARELAKNPEFNIFLLVDNIHTLGMLDSSLNPIINSSQIIRNVTVIPWELLENSYTTIRPDMVIETFGCLVHRPLNTNFVRSVPHINIEYLSAEDWTLDYHLKPSLTPYQQKFFYFLGFTENSGGLFIEKNYYQQEVLFKNNITSIDDFYHQYHIVPSVNKTVIFLFGYESNIWNQWIHIWDQLNFDYQLWIADTQAFNAIDEAIKKYNPRIQLLPFVNQVDFDKLLWLSDIAIIRGEDSFIRAQLAGVPFFWHTYPQDGNIHLQKLEAFWQQVKFYYDADIFFHQQRLSLELNQGTSLSHQERYNSWQELVKHQTTWKTNTQTWKNFLFSQNSAYEKLTQFIKKLLE